MVTKINKWIKWIFIDNYMWYTALDALVLLITGKSFIGYILTPFFIYYLVFTSHRRGKSTIIDWAMIALLISMVISWLINYYAHWGILVLRCISGQISIMMCYFIGQSLSTEEYDNIFRKSLLPAAILSIIGLYLYFFPTGWYLAQTADVNEYGILEATRMRSIFLSPYTLSYMSAILLTYIFFRIFQYKESVKKYVAYIVIFVLALLFCMQRAPMGGAVIGIAGAMSYGGIYKHRIGTILKVSLSFIIAGVLIMFVLSKMKSDQYEYLMYKLESITENREDFINDRYNISYMDVKESWLGDGAGRHNPWASKYDSTNMADGQYKKVQQEQGDIGLALFYLFLGLVVLKCAFNFKYLSFDLCIMIFLLVSMIGANPLTNIGTHGPIFFLIMGHISSFKAVRVKKLKFKKNETELPENAVIR